MLGLCLTLVIISSAKVSREAETVSLADGLPDSDLSKSRYNTEVKHESHEDLDGAEWLIKLIPAPIHNEWTLDNIWSVESDEEKADLLAKELGLMNLGRVDPFPSVFRFRHDQSVARKSSSKGVRVMRNSENLDEVDTLLVQHPSVAWASKEKALVREKRTNYLQLNDPMFDKQWHLVRFLLF